MKFAKRVLTTALPFLLSGLVQVAAAQMCSSTTPEDSRNWCFSGIVEGSTSGLVADIVDATTCPVPGLVAPLKVPRMSPEPALSTYERRTAWQSANLASYSDTTAVRAELPESSRHGEFQFERRYVAPHSLKFKVVRFTGNNFVNFEVIMRILRSEIDHVQKDDPTLTAIVTANYKFSYKATVSIQGRIMHVFQVKPRKKRVGLFKGSIYLDAYTGSLVYAVATLVKSPSFFIKKIEFVQQYADSGPFTFPSDLHMEASTRLVGRVIVDMEHRDYHPMTFNLQPAHHVPAAR